MKQKSSDKQDRSADRLVLDQETIADLEIDDREADRVKGAGSGSRPAGTLTAV